MFVLEARGTPLVAFQVHSRREAEELRKEQWFTEELAALRSEGRPIWDGSGLVLRAGLEDEIKIYREGDDELRSAISNARAIANEGRLDVDAPFGIYSFEWRSFHVLRYHKSE